MKNREFPTKPQNAGNCSTPKNAIRQAERRRAILDQRRPLFFKKTLALAAVVLALVGLWQGIGAYLGHIRIFSTVNLEVHPAIQLKLNRAGTVREVQALNEEGKTILKGMQLKNVSRTVAVNTLINSLVKHRYLSEEENTVLLTVQDEDPHRCEELKQEWSRELSQSLKELAVLSQSAIHDGDVERLADQYGVTLGKAQLIRQLCRQNSFYSFDSLCGLSLNELNLLSESGDLKLENVSSQGTASTAALAGEAAAKDAVLNQVGASFSRLSSFSCRLALEGNGLVYEAELTLDDSDYEYVLDAYTLEILHWKTEPHDSLPPSADSSPALTKEQALEKALEHSGVSKDKVTRFVVEADRDRGIPVYEVDFSTESIDYEYVLDSGSGKVLKYERELRVPAPSTVNSSQYTQEQIRPILLAHAGCKEEDTTHWKWELDREHQTTVYEVEFRTVTAEYNYQVCAFTGNILSFQKESPSEAPSPVPTSSAASAHACLLL